MARFLIQEFSLKNPIYANAVVTIYQVDPVALTQTSTLATVYGAPVGPGTLSNPITLDGTGKWVVPPYVTGPVILYVTGAFPAYSTGIIGQFGSFRGPWAPLTAYFAGDTVTDTLAGLDSRNVYYALGAHVAGSSFSSDLAQGKWVLYVDAEGAANASVTSTLAQFNLSVTSAQASATTATIEAAAALVSATSAAASATSAAASLAALSSSTVTTTLFASPPPIGNVAPSTIAATVLTVTNGGTIAGQVMFSGNGAGADPDPSVYRAIKIAQGGLAVLGGIKTDTLTITGSGSTGDASAMSAKATGASSARTLAAHFADVMSIEDEGVVHDPTCAHAAANTTAYQNLLNAAAGVARVRHRAGITVFVTAALAPPDGTVWEHDGLIKLAPNAGSLVSAAHAWGNGGLYGIGTFDGNASNQTGSGVSGGMVAGDGKSNFRISGITFQNFKNWPINITNMSDAIAYDCWFTSCGSSAEFAITGDDVWFINCKTRLINDLSIGMYGAITSGGIIDCDVRSGSSSGIFAFCDASQPSPPSNILIQGNEVTGCGTADGSPGIYVGVGAGASGAPSRVTVANNSSYANHGPGILVSASTDTLVEGNRTYQNNTTQTNVSLSGTTADIFLDGAALRTTVAANQITNPGGGSAQVYAIYSQSAQQASILGNVTTDTRGTQLMLSGLGGTMANKSFVDGNRWGSGINAGDAASYIQNSTAGLNYDVKLGTSALAVTGLSALQTVSFSGNSTNLGAYTGATLASTFNLDGTGRTLAGWNLSGGGGELDFVVNRGAGSFGGLRIYDLAATSHVLTKIFDLDGSGNLTMVGTATLNATRIKGPNLSGVSGTTIASTYTLDTSGIAFFGNNLSAGGGETDFVINRGAGSTGGLNIYDLANTTHALTKIMGIDGAGNFAVAGNISSSGGGLTLPVSNAAVVLGNPLAANTPYVDFFSSGNNQTDARILVINGTTISGQGQMQITVGNILFASSIAPGSNPSTGKYYLYIDPGDNKLKARGSSGTITILAVP